MGVRVSVESAAYAIKILDDEIYLLNNEAIWFRDQAEQVRLAEEAEAQRVAAEAAEQARIAAEAEAKRIADEAAAAEAARIAAEAEAARLAAEAEAQRVAAEAAEQARLAAEAEAKRIADEAAAVEAARVAAEAAEQARLAAEAEAQRVAAEAAAEQARVAAEAVRIANTFRAPGPASAAGPLFMTSAGTVAIVEAAAVTLQAAIREAITALGGVVASVGTGLVVGVSALFYSSKLANGELPERYAFSTPVSDLASDLGQDLNAVAAAGGTVDLPYRISSKTAADGRSEVFVVKTDGVTVPSKVRVVAATYDATQKIYTATTADVPPRTLTWTPIVNPGNSSTTSPAEQPVPPVYTGATVTPVEGRIDTFPAVSEASFDDFITVFPADSGLPPIYTMFRDRREDPGVATGVGQPVSGIWLGAASQGEGAPIPSQIADQLRGKEFKNFREFRETFWKAVANDSELSKQFSSVNLARMKNNGYAPYAIPSEQVGGKVKFELHHVVFLKNNGELYGIDNLRVVTPKEHDALHSQKAGE
ncbi:TPA: S-type pyocin domain-containing protein [Klebsiella quasipneumoniae]|nr:S-type pyocin domain-containing protein [Klebsiella quasipneumoniae]